MIGDDDQPRKKASHEIGQDLSHVSVAELRERVDMLTAEIARIEAEIVAKEASRGAADQVFKV